MQTLFQPLITVRSLLVGLLLLGGSGCDLSQAVPSDWVLSKTSQEMLRKRTAEMAGGEEAAAFRGQFEVAKAEVLTALETLFGTAQAPHWPMGRSGDEAPTLLVEAAAAYQAECTHCHGAEGFGNGPSSPFLEPAPWNFSIGVFPRTAPQGGLPKPKDMKDLLAYGIDEASMPPFERLGEETLIALSGHVLLLTRRAQVEWALVDAWIKAGPNSLQGDKPLEIYQAWESDMANASKNNTPVQD